MNNHSNQTLQRLEAAMDAMRRVAVNARDRLGDGLQLTRTQLEILMMLGDKSSQTVGELAQQLFLTQSAVTQTVDTLVRRGLIGRRPDDTDRRVIRLHSTAEGRAIIGHVRGLKHRHLQELMTRLSDTETSALITAIEKMAALMDENHNQKN